MATSSVIFSQPSWLCFPGAFSTWHVTLSHLPGLCASACSCVLMYDQPSTLLLRACLLGAASLWIYIQSLQPLKQFSLGQPPPAFCSVLMLVPALHHTELLAVSAGPASVNLCLLCPLPCVLPCSLPLIHCFPVYYIMRLLPSSLPRPCLSHVRARTHTLLIQHLRHCFILAYLPISVGL